jgi:hypothetical protein
MFLYCGCDQVGPIGESGSLRREGWGESRGYSKVPRWWSPPVSIKDRAVWPRWQALICNDHLSGFMGLNKPSSPGTTLLEGE